MMELFFLKEKFGYVLRITFYIVNRSYKIVNKKFHLNKVNKSIILNATWK